MTKYILCLIIAGLLLLCLLLLTEREAMGDCLRTGAKIHITAAALYADCGRSP